MENLKLLKILEKRLVSPQKVQPVQRIA